MEFIQRINGKELLKYLNEDDFASLVDALEETEEIVLDLTLEWLSEPLPEVKYLPNGDPGYPAEPAEFTLTVVGILNPYWCMQIHTFAKKFAKDKLAEELKAFKRAVDSYVTDNDEEIVRANGYFGGDE